VAFVIGIAVCLGFEINVADALIQSVPAFDQSTALEGVWGSVFTGAGMAGMASYWHNNMKVKSAKAAEAKANAITTANPADLGSMDPPPTN
jgi:hypothetical protein